MDILKSLISLFVPPRIDHDWVYQVADGGHDDESHSRVCAICERAEVRENDTWSDAWWPLRQGVPSRHQAENTEQNPGHGVELATPFTGMDSV